MTTRRGPKKGGGWPRLQLDEGRLRELWLAGLPAYEIGPLLGCCAALVSRRARQIGLPARAINTGLLPQAKIAIAYQQGLSVRQIIEKLRPQFPTLVHTTVRRLLRARGVKLRARGGPAITRVEECVRLIRAGFECAQAAQRLGLSASQVRYRVRKTIGPRPTGRRSRMPVRVVVSRVLAGETCRQVARDYGCTAQAVDWHVRKHKARRGQAAIDTASA